MKPSIAIALIICGTLLVLSPAVIDLLQQQQVMSTLQARPDFETVTAGKPMSQSFTVACMAIGTAMIAISTYLSVRFPTVAQSRHAQPNGEPALSA